MENAIRGLDHLVLTVRELQATLAFYTGVMGMQAEVFEGADGTRRTALRFGTQKINLHVAEAEFDPRAERPTPGSADLCFLTDRPLTDWQAHLKNHGIPVEDGPVPRTGATGPLMSIYLRDPDGNLIEIASPR